MYYQDHVLIFIMLFCFGASKTKATQQCSGITLGSAFGNQEWCCSGGHIKDAGALVLVGCMQGQHSTPWTIALTALIWIKVWAITEVIFCDCFSQRLLSSIFMKRWLLSRRANITLSVAFIYAPLGAALLSWTPAFSARVLSIQT